VGTGSPLCSTSATSFLACSRINSSGDCASGSKRPSFCAFFHARTELGSDSYVEVGNSYFSTEDTSVKFGRADGGRTSWTYANNACQQKHYRGIPVMVIYVRTLQSWVTSRIKVGSSSKQEIKIKRTYHNFTTSSQSPFTNDTCLTLDP
jgi:hypothetical protein